jgi:hypothetical protein
MAVRKLSIAVALVALLFGLVALAQPKKGRKGAKPPEPVAAAQADAGPGSGSAGEGEGDDDLGPPPPKGAKRSDQRTSASPLNPLPEEFPDGSVAPPPGEYDRVLGDIATLRSRAAALTTTLFKSKLRVVVTTDGDQSRITKLVITLDDGVVFTAPERFSADDGRVVYEHAVAPGHHVLGVEIERYDARGREYTTWQASKMSIVVPENKLLSAELELEDDSDMAVDFPNDQDGEYELNVKLRARVRD